MSEHAVETFVLDAGALIARRFSAAVITSDPDDILTIDHSLKAFIVEI